MLLSSDEPRSGLTCSEPILEFDRERLEGLFAAGLALLDLTGVVFVMVDLSGVDRVETFLGAFLFRAPGELLGGVDLFGTLVLALLCVTRPFLAADTSDLSLILSLASGEHDLFCEALRFRVIAGGVLPASSPFLFVLRVPTRSSSRVEDCMLETGSRCMVIEMFGPGS